MKGLNPDIWKGILERNCANIEKDILGFSFTDPNLLMRALLRKAAFKDQNFPAELRKYGFQNGLDTFGDKFLDFAIFDHFLDKFLSDTVSEKMVNGHREWYSQNVILQEFSLSYIKLQKYVVWGQDEFNKKIWDQTTTKILADSFEALVGAIYKDQGIEGVEKMLREINFYEKIDELRSKKGQKKSEFHIPEKE
jgi:dsRNA-specific ribonuclease